MSKKIRSSTQVHKASGRGEGDNTISLKRLEIKTCFRSGYVQTFLWNRSSEIFCVGANNFNSISIISSISLMDFTDAIYKSLAESKKLTSHLTYIRCDFLIPLKFLCYRSQSFTLLSWRWKLDHMKSKYIFYLSSISSRPICPWKDSKSCVVIEFSCEISISKYFVLNMQGEK